MKVFSIGVTSYFICVVPIFYFFILTKNSHKYLQINFNGCREYNGYGIFSLCCFICNYFVVFFASPPSAWFSPIIDALHKPKYCNYRELIMIIYIFYVSASSSFWFTLVHSQNCSIYNKILEKGKPFWFHDSFMLYISPFVISLSLSLYSCPSSYRHWPVVCLLH